jgi:hypothetical protein
MFRASVALSNARSYCFSSTAGWERPRSTLEAGEWTNISFLSQKLRDGFSVTELFIFSESVGRFSRKFEGSYNYVLQGNQFFKF